jgi:hypothetical protein
MRPWLRRSGVLHDPDRGVFALCSGLHRRAHSWNDKRFRRRGSEGGRAVAHLWHIGCPPQCSARCHSAWSARGVGSLAHAARGPRRKYYGSPIVHRALFDRPHAPRLRNASIAPIRFCKKRNAEPRQKQKHRHTVIDPASRDHSDCVIDLRGIQSVLRECDCIPVVQQSASAYVVREIA